MAKKTASAADAVERTIEEEVKAKRIPGIKNITPVLAWIIPPSNPLFECQCPIMYVYLSIHL